VDQTVFGVPGGNCFSACVATILECDLTEVPYFMGGPEEWERDGGKWWERFQAWLEPRGLAADYYQPGKNCARKHRPNFPHLLGGRSPRDLLTDEEKLALGIVMPAGEDLLHSVVAVGHEVVHDPHPSRAGLLDHRDFIVIRSIHDRPGFSYDASDSAAHDVGGEA